MLSYFSLILTLSGACIIALSFFSLYQTFKEFSKYSYQKKLSSRFITVACLIMMIAFFMGYLMFSSFIFFLNNQDPIIFLVAVIFFFGGIFVYCMVEMQKKMSNDVKARSLETIYSLISAVEAKDVYTKGHSEHVKNLCEVVYAHLPKKYTSIINKAKLTDAAMLHDIGKIGIPDAVLNKPAALTKEEYTIIQQHPERGYNILKNTIYSEIGNWVLYHHERIDGKGYYGISCDKLPIEAKILAITDTFSALFTDRVYRKKFSYEQSINILQKIRGTQLDEELLDIFLSIDRSEILKASV